MAIAEILAAGATVALDAVGVAAAVLVGLALTAWTLRARRGRMGSRLIAASALALCVGGVGFAAMPSTRGRRTEA